MVLDLGWQEIDLRFKIIDMSNVGRIAKLLNNADQSPTIEE